MLKRRNRAPIVDDNTRLGDAPLTWLKYIEPNILRVPRVDPWDNCYEWYGTLNSAGYPMLSFKTYPDDTQNQKRHEVIVRRYVMRMFWEYPDAFVVYTTCKNTVCVRPDHLVVTYRNDPDYHGS